MREVQKAAVSIRSGCDRGHLAGPEVPRRHTGGAEGALAPAQGAARGVVFAAGAAHPAGDRPQGGSSGHGPFGGFWCWAC